MKVDEDVQRNPERHIEYELDNLDEKGENNKKEEEEEETKEAPTTTTKNLRYV